jgi:hypothetical protein
MNTIGKILNIFPSQIGLAKQKETSDRDPNQGGYRPNDGSNSRNPTEEEAKEAQKILANFETVLKNELLVDLVAEEGSFFLAIKDKTGRTLRVLKKAEVIRLLEFNQDGSKSAQSGRILDSRI